MNQRASRSLRKRRREAGIALLISIFVLLLISVVAIAVVVSSGTESALTGNYRSSTSVYYAALAGVEEARARLRPNDPNSFKNTNPNLLPPPGTPWGIGYVDYIFNPGPSDNYATILANYPDNEYDAEFGLGALNKAQTAGTVVTTPSVWNGPLAGLPFSGPFYKWVRINAVSEKSLNLDVDGDGLPDSTTPLYYDNTNPPNLHFSNSPTSGSVQLPQALELTALAVLPNGSQKLLQYLTAASVTLPPFLAALTISDSPGSNATYLAPANNANFLVKGDDYDCNGSLKVPAAVFAIGVFQAPDVPLVKGGIQTVPPGIANGYTGSGGAPSVNTVSGSLTASQLNLMVQAIQQAADATIPNGTAAVQTSFLNSLLSQPNPMSANNPMTLVVNGDLDLAGWGGTGYGLLLVTGNLYYDPSTSWNGIILVIGNGYMGNHDKHLNGLISGAVYVANTQGGANLGGGTVSFTPDMDGFGIRYSSCWVQASQPTGSFKILSFHEISQ